MVRAHGVVQAGAIRLRGPVDLPDGTEVEVVIEPCAEQTLSKEERRKRAIDRILAREPINIRPYTVRDLIEFGRER